MKAKQCGLIPCTQIASGKTAVDAAKLMQRSRSRYLFVTKKGIPMGVLSALDIVEQVIAGGKSPIKTKVDEIMKKPIIACNADDTLSDVYMKIAKHNLVIIPVLEKDKISGLLTAQEVLKHFVHKGCKL